MVHLHYWRMPLLFLISGAGTYFALGKRTTGQYLGERLKRPYFPEETHGLVDDWASVAFYLLFFLAGFVLLSSKNITESIRKQRGMFLFEAIIVSIMMFTLPHIFGSEKAENLVWDILSIFVAWSCGITGIGFARQHLNRNSKFRKLANEAYIPVLPPTPASHYCGWILYHSLGGGHVESPGSYPAEFCRIGCDILVPDPAHSIYYG